MPGIKYSAVIGAFIVNGIMLAGLLTVAAQTRPPDSEPVPLQVSLIAPQPEPTRPSALATPQPVVNKPSPPPPPLAKAAAKTSEVKPKQIARQAPAPIAIPQPSSPTLQTAPTTMPADDPPPPTSVSALPKTADVAVAAPQAAEPSLVKEPPRADASWSGNVPPPYPALARRMGEQGEVRLDIQIATDGTVSEVKLKKSSGSTLLDQTAIETIKRWHFKPATVDGRAVAEWYYNWRWVFKLEG